MGEAHGNVERERMKSGRQPLKNFRKLAVRKLSSESGESIGEVLAATIVVALGSILLATMVSSSKNIITKSEKAYDKYIAQRNYLETRGGIRDDSVDAGDSGLQVSKGTENISIKVTGGPEGEKNLQVEVNSVTAVENDKVIFKEYESKEKANS